MKSMLNSLLLHPATKLQLSHLLANPPHAILLAASTGSGKSKLATTLAQDLLQVIDLYSYPYFSHISKLQNKQEISIEQVREVISVLKLKVPGNQKVQRVVFIEDAHTMSTPAQNSLLKILEEPPSGTIFILSATSTKDLLPTITSRLQTIDLQPIDLKSSSDFWREQYSLKAIESAWNLSGGAPGLMQALLTNDQQHPLKEAVQLTRKYLKAKKYERLLLNEKLSAHKEQLNYFLDALSRILGFLHRQAVVGGKKKQAANLLAARKATMEAQKSLQCSANPKLTLLNLTLSLKV